MILQELKSRFNLFRNYNYALFTTSGLLATFGNSLLYITITWTMFSKTKSVGSVAILMLCLWLPGIIFGQIFGFIADRYNRKYLIVLSNFVRGLAIILYISLIGFIDINVYYLALVLGIFMSFYMPAALPMIKEIVLEKDLLIANATMDMLYEIGGVIAIGMSGWLLYVFGDKLTMLLGGVFFLIAGFCNVLMLYKHEKIPSTKNDNLFIIFLNDYKLAFEYLSINKHLFSIYIIQMLVIILLSTLPIIIIPFITINFNANAKDFAIFEGLFSIGVIFGSLISPALCRYIEVFGVLFLQAIILAVGLLLFSQIDNILLAEIIYFFIGYTMSSWAIILTQAQNLTENKMQGKMQGICYSISGIFILFLNLLINIYEKEISINTIYIIESVFAILMLILVSFSFKSLISKEEV